MVIQPSQILRNIEKAMLLPSTVTSYRQWSYVVAQLYAVGANNDYPEIHKYTWVYKQVKCAPVTQDS